MRQPKGMVIHFNPAEFTDPADFTLLESLNLEIIDLVNVVLLLWSVFHDGPDRIYDVVIEEVAEMIMGDSIGNRATALVEGADHVVELCIRIHSYLHPAIQDLPDQLHDAVQAGLREDLESGILHVVGAKAGPNTLLLSID